MAKHEWKVEPIGAKEDLGFFARLLEEKLNELEKNGFEVQKMELQKDDSILLIGRRPARRAST